MKITDKATVRDCPIKVLQFGEGNFLRAFADYMIDITNEKGVFGGNVAIVKPIDFGSLDAFREQNNLYTVVLRGKQNGDVINESRIVSSVAKVMDARKDYAEYMSLAGLDSLRFVISNTTEAGIVFNETDTMDGLPTSYPAKLTKFLYERYRAFGGDKEKGLIILPVELIEDNGKKLKSCVLQTAKMWNLSSGFTDWVENDNIFCSTLVDRIVTGYPKDKAAEIETQLGYSDKLLDVCEPFACWVIESDKDISAEFPLDKVGLPVIFTDNQKPYRERKVRILNGAHTSSVLGGYLYGLDIVRDCMHDEYIGDFVHRAVNEEIAPFVKLPETQVAAFAKSVFERFENPFIDHSLLSISLNSVSKWKARVLPSFKDYFEKYGKLPRFLTFSMAALIAFYSSDDFKDGELVAARQNGDTYKIHDNPEVLRFFANNLNTPDFIDAVLSNTDFWGEDLTVYDGFCEKTKYWYKKIMTDATAAVKEVLNR